MRDVTAQAECQIFASRYNQQPKVPKAIEFVEAYLIQRTNPQVPEKERWMVIEPFLSGKYVKHGKQSSPQHAWQPVEDRNTPAAFCHFTFHTSNKKKLVAHVEGVGDRYTNPAMYTNSAQPVGNDQGMPGIMQFFKSHQCNDICRALQLPQFGAVKMAGVDTQPLSADQARAPTPAK
jgi:elongation factor 2 kinase